MYCADNDIRSLMKGLHRVLDAVHMTL
jgi:hypothetical protein